jgi:hypothetical protein
MREPIFHTYHAHFDPMVLNPGMSDTPGLQIQLPGRYLYLKKVLFNVFILEPVNTRIIQTENNEEVETTLSIGSWVPGNFFGSDFISIAPGIPSGDRSLWIYRPGMYFFDSVEFINIINVAMNIVNISALNTYEITPDLTISFYEK